MCLRVTYKKKRKYFFCILKVTERKESDPRSWIRIHLSEVRIWIRSKRSEIPKTAFLDPWYSRMEGFCYCEKCMVCTFLLTFLSQAMSLENEINTLTSYRLSLTASLIYPCRTWTYGCHTSYLSPGYVHYEIETLCIIIPRHSRFVNFST
jgi:hypothetical protein